MLLRQRDVLPTQPGDGISAIIVRFAESLSTRWMSLSASSGYSVTVAVTSEGLRALALDCRRLRGSGWVVGIGWVGFHVLDRRRWDR